MRRLELLPDHGGLLRGLGLRLDLGGAAEGCGSGLGGAGEGRGRGRGLVLLGGREGGCGSAGGALVDAAGALGRPRRRGRGGAAAVRRSRARAGARRRRRAPAPLLALLALGRSRSSRCSTRPALPLVALLPLALLPLALAVPARPCAARRSALHPSRSRRRELGARRAGQHERRLALGGAAVALAVGPAALAVLGALERRRGGLARGFRRGFLRAEVVEERGRLGVRGCNGSKRGGGRDESVRGARGGGGSGRGRTDRVQVRARAPVRRRALPGTRGSRRLHEVDAERKGQHAVAARGRGRGRERESARRTVVDGALARVGLGRRGGRALVRRKLDDGLADVACVRASVAESASSQQWRRREEGEDGPCLSRKDQPS